MAKRTKIAAGFADDSFDDDLRLLEELIQEEMYEKSEKRLHHFFINFWNTFDPQPLVNNWHLECLSEHIQAALNRDIRRLVINIPPRSSKSTTASISAPCWHWIENPQEKFWLISHSARLFMQNIVYARRILDHPSYKNRWCDPLNPEHLRYTLAKDVNTKTRIENTAGGYIMGGSPTATALGMGYSVAILDDILDSEESYSPTAIENVNNWFTQTFLNRSNDVNTDVIIIVMQRLHENDLSDYVNRKYGDMGWFNLILPAKYDPDRTFISPIGYNDKRTQRNQLLDPVRLSEEFLLTQSKNKIIYNTRYQQNPEATTDGYFIKDEWLQDTVLKPQKHSQMITVWDLSITDNPTSSYTVGLVVCRAGDEFYIIDMWRKQCEVQEQLDGIRKLKKKYPRSIIGIEARANGHAAMSMLNREIKNIYAIEPRLFGGDKEQRLASVVDYFRNKKVFIYNPTVYSPDRELEDTYSPDEIKKELKSFPLGKNNDIVDCVSYAIQYLAEYGQETQAIISKGMRITFTEEDHAKEKALQDGKGAFITENDKYPFEIFFDGIPSRDYITGIEW